jgi:hypothetical protein
MNTLDDLLAEPEFKWLTVDGFTNAFTVTESERENGQVQLRREVEELKAAREWIRQRCVATKKINHKGYDSYGLKHVVEREIDVYMPNGVLIAAMLLEYYRLTCILCGC